MKEYKLIELDNGSFRVSFMHCRISGEGPSPNEALEAHNKAFNADLDFRKKKRNTEVERARKRGDIRLQECRVHEAGKDCHPHSCNRAHWEKAGYFIAARCRFCGKWEDATRHMPGPLQSKEGSWVCGSCDLY